MSAYSIRYPLISETEFMKGKPNQDKRCLEGKKEIQIIIGAPTPGFYSKQPLGGMIVYGGQQVGTLRVLTQDYQLVLPDEISGEVIVENERDFIFPVQYGQELFRLNPKINLKNKAIFLGSFNSKDKGGTKEVSKKGFLIKAFTTGIFYRKPSPDAPPFVTMGQKIEKGKALGLIEVMKTFNHIIFHGTDKSDTGIIKEIFIEDSREVKLGEPLFLIE